MTQKSRVRFVGELLPLLGLQLFCACISQGGAPPEPADLSTSPSHDLADAGTAQDLKPAKTLLWLKQLGASTNVDSVKQLAVDAAGNLFVACQFSSTTDFGDGPRTTRGNHDVAIIKLNAAGELGWVRHFGGTQADVVFRMVTDHGGNVIIAGAFSDSIDFGGGPVTSHGKADFYLAKYADDGRFMWAKAIGSTEFEDNYAGLAVDASNNVYFAGPYGLGGTNVPIDLGGGPLPANGATDSFLLKLDPSGGYVTGKRIGGIAHDYIITLALDPSGDVVIGGGTTGTIDLGGGPMDPGSPTTQWAYVARFDPSFAYKWAIGYYTTGSRVTELAVDANGAIAAAGTYKGTLQTRTSSLSSTTSSDHAFLLQLDASGAEKWARSVATGSLIDYPMALVAAGSQLVLGGFFDGSGNFGSGPRTTLNRDAFVSYYSLSGAPQGVRQYGGPSEDFTTAIAPAADALYVGGAFEATAKFDGDVLTSKGFIDGFVVKLPPTPPVTP